MREVRAVPIRRRWRTARPGRSKAGRKVEIRNTNFNFLTYGDSSGSGEKALVTMDARRFGSGSAYERRREQLRRECLERELNKAYCAFEAVKTSGTFENVGLLDFFKI